ncbi:hypothetical protein K9M74_04370 [Candidatus Woesearchaeota archaeon]|nr:hypothetical protein [Candidatus Woesearchaeota archaeon]
MRKGLIVLVLFFFGIIGVVLAQPASTTLLNQDYCQELLQLHQWKEITFPESFPLQNGLVNVDNQGSVAYVKLSNGSIVAAGCSSLEEYDYTLKITVAGAANLLTAGDPVKTYRQLKREGELNLKGETQQARRTVRKLAWRALLFPASLR